MQAKTLLPAALALLLGVGLGFGLGIIGNADAPPPRAALPTIPDEPEADTPAPRESRPAPRADVVRPATPTRPTQDNDSVTAALQAEAQDALSRIELPSGDGVITGKFRDTAGKPVQGIAVDFRVDTGPLHPDRPNRAEFEDANEFLEAMMRYHYMIEYLRLLGTRRVESDEAGEFKVANVPESGGFISIAPKGYLIAPGAPTFARNVRPGETLEITLMQTLPVRVLLEPREETDPANASVRWTPFEGAGVAGARSVPPGTESTIELVPGVYDLRASIGRRGGSAVRLDIRESPPEGVVRLSFLPTAGLVGSLSFPQGRPRSFNLRIAQVQPMLSDFELLVQGRGGPPATIGVNAQTSRFQYEHPQPGEYVIGVVVSNRLLAAQRVSLGAGLTTADLAVSPPDDIPWIRVTLRAPGPVDDVRFVVSRSDARGNLNFDQWVLSETEHALYFRDLSNLRNRPPAARVTATVREYGQAGREFSPGSDRDVELTFTEPAILSMMVEGAAVGLTQVHVTVRDLSDGRVVHSFQLYLDAARANRNQPQKVQSGRYQLQLTRSTGGGPALAREDVNLQPGSNNLRVRCPELSNVRLDASAVRPSNTRIEQRDTGIQFGASFDRAGICVLQQLPPGSYRLYYRAQGDRTEQTFDFTAPFAGTIIISR